MSAVKGGKLVSAIALGAAVIGGIAATPARAQTETTPFQASPTAQSPLNTVSFRGKDVDLVYSIEYGSQYGKCGSLVLTTYHRGGHTSKILATFSASPTGPGCNPVSLSSTNGGATVGVLISQQSGAGGNAITFNASNGQFISQVPVPGPSSVVGVSSATSTGTGLPGHHRDGTENSYLIITESDAILAAEVASNGALSAPQKIFTFAPGDGKGGFVPFGPAVMGADGNLYGTTNQGGAKSHNGIVYRLSPTTSGNTTTWVETVLHTFSGGADGGRPVATVAFDSDGNLYGTTTQGGMLNGSLTSCGAGGFPGTTDAGCGVVFELIYSDTAPWREKVLHTFTGGDDGAEPEAPVILDSRNNIYGTKFAGGNVNLAACSGPGISGATPGCGVVFKLHRGSHAETVLYAFMDGADGAEPQGPVLLDGPDIYGTAVAGGNPDCVGGLGLGYANGCGVVFEITP